MFKFLKKEESIEVPVINQSEDWTKEIKRSQKISQEVEQLSLIYDNNNINKYFPPTFVKTRQNCRFYHKKK